MSCSPPYCLGTTGTGCVPALTPPYTRSCPCNCCPPKCYDKLTVNFVCGTPGTMYSPPRPDITCGNSFYPDCCKFNPDPACPSCPDAFPPDFDDVDYSDNCRYVYFFHALKARYKNFLRKTKETKDVLHPKNYHDFFGFTSDDYSSHDYYFFLEEEIKALSEVGAGGTTCGSNVSPVPCQTLTFEMTTSGCCFSCTPVSKTVCIPQDNCGISGADPREFVWGQCYVAIGDGTITLNVPDPPCGTIYYYINGNLTKSLHVKNCHLFCVEVYGAFKHRDCCACFYRTFGDYLTIHNWGAAAFRKHNKNLMQKNLAEKMKKIKF